MRKATVSLLFMLVLLCNQTMISFANPQPATDNLSYQQEENTAEVADYDLRMEVDNLSFTQKNEVLTFTMILRNTGGTSLELIKVQHNLFPGLTFEKQVLEPQEEMRTTATYTVLEGDLLQGSIASYIDVQMRSDKTEQIIEKQSGIMLRKPVVLPEFETRQTLPRSGVGSQLLLGMTSLVFLTLAGGLLFPRRQDKKVDR